MIINCVSVDTIVKNGSESDKDDIKQIKFDDIKFLVNLLNLSSHNNKIKRKFRSDRWLDVV